MKIRTTDYSRTLIVSEIGHDLAGVPDELQITINYTGEADIHKAAVFDKFIIPKIIEAINK